MFAVALWTESQKRLVLVRDRMGIKPLYYYRSGEDVYFGSELKAILEHPEVPRHLDLDALDTYLSLNYVAGHADADPRDPEGAAGAPAGMAAREDCTAKRGGSSPDGPRRGDLAGRGEGGTGRAAARLRCASTWFRMFRWACGHRAAWIRRRSCITRRRRRPGRLKTFSVSFQGRSFDESPYFREIARIYGTDHHEFDLNPDVELQSAIEDFAYYSDEPSADAGALPVWFLSRMSRRARDGGALGRRRGRVVRRLPDLSGGPAGAAVPRLAPAGLRRLMRGALDRYMPVSDEKISLEYKLKRWLEGSLLDPDEAHFFWNGTFSPAQLAQIRPGTNGSGLRRLVDELGIAAGRRAEPLSDGGSELLSAGRHSVQDGPDEHGAFARSASAVPGSSDRGIRGVAAAAI